ncbi:hypothetical protein ACFLWA_12645 [Chloroflexota bacterium]
MTRNLELIALAAVLLFLERATKVLPASNDELLLRGITAEAADRIVALKKSDLRLQSLHGSLESLERVIETQGISPDDHRLYTDLLEWRAIRCELSDLVDLLETL